MLKSGYGAHSTRLIESAVVMMGICIILKSFENMVGGFYVL